MHTRKVIILGSTGSIGTQTLEVVEHLNRLSVAQCGHAAFEVVGLCAGSQVTLLEEQARRFNVQSLAAVHVPDGKSLSGARVFQGSSAAEELVRSVEADLVVAAIVGIAGLPATLAAIELGRDVALANKETLVAAGALVTRLIGRSPPSKRSRLLPVDSEHAGVWQCLLGVCGSWGVEGGSHGPPLEAGAHVRRVILTASGGPFRTWSKDAIRSATPEQALRHPTWTMGGKITIDSASLMNKALELIEAHWLFGIPREKLDALVHPQSIVHALVETAEGSVLAQLGAPDMRTPIQAALLAPDRAPGMVKHLDLTQVRALEFEPVDEAKFPAMTLWRRCLGSDASTTRGATLNAANEEAVSRFLNQAAGHLSFGQVTDVVCEAVEALSVRECSDLSAVLEADGQAREWVRRRIGRSGAAS